MSESESAPAPASITKINYLFPGSFSPVTVSHVGAVEKLLAGEGLTDDEKKIAPPPKINVYIIPVSDRYPKESVKPGTTVYLSEETRKEFLETAVQPLVEKGGSVIVSDAEFEYGKGRVNDHRSTTNQYPTTSFLAVNYNKPVRTNGQSYLEHPENFGDGARTYLILGADNAYVDMVGWADPKTILDNMHILVITRGNEPTLEMKNAKPIKCYYEGATANTYSAILAERKEIYSKTFPTYDLQQAMDKNTTKLDFTVVEASSSLIRSLILHDQKADVNSLTTVLTQLKENNPSIPDVATFLEDGAVKKDDESVNMLVGFLTPISVDKLRQSYSAAAAAAAPGGGARSKKTKRRKGRRNSRSKTRKRRLTNKRRGNRRRNRTHH